MEEQTREKQTNVKIGDYLHQVVYWTSFRKSERDIRKVKVKKINPKSYSLVYWNWKINKSEIGKGWFTTQKEALEYALKNHKGELEVAKDNVKTFQKECNYLKKKIKELNMEVHKK